jgi:hypothetical protein
MSAMAIIEKTARPTITAVELDVGDELHFTLANGEMRRIVLERTGANVIHTTLKEPKVEQAGAVTNYHFHAALRIDGVSVITRREIATQNSFYEPRELMGLHIYLDAVDDIFNFLTEDHGPCRPRKKARLAVQDASLGICPVLLHPWCPLPEGGLRIEDCYNGEDVWLGAYFGAAAHGGLDINHPAGTPIYTPFAIDDHELYNRLENGDNNNRWKGRHKWPDGSTWEIRVCHVIRLYHEEHASIEAGALLADGAGVLIGSHEHSHFVFLVEEPGAGEDDAIFLDPWILFRQMYLDRARTTSRRPR